MKLFKSIFLFVALSASLVSCRVHLEPVEILTFKQQLEKLFPNAEISKMEAKDHFTRAYHIVLNQPLDHNNKEAGTFQQHIYLSHVDENMPTVLVTEGYNAYPKTYELSKILKGNQVQVEYRFYGKSRPNPIPWEYLKNDQAIEDYHFIVTKLRRLYDGKWISTGISKGGETVLIYKSKYPWDVEVAVPYVAPLIDTQEDPKTEAHINTIGTEECREKITEFQRNVLENRDGVIEEIKKYAEEKKLGFTEVPMEEALEYAVLELPFSFWQWGGNCESIPSKNATVNELFEYVNSIVGISFYSDQTYFDLLPSYYQHWTELGYYGFDTTPVKDLLQVVKKPTNKRFAPKNVDLTYNPDYIKNVRDFVENKGNKILYIYGEYDTWGACAPNPKPHVDALKMVLKEGSHTTRIKSFSKEDQQRMYDKLQSWLGYSVTIYPLED
ncbi:S28 family serine protease [Lutibacter sp. TH_r2]|uniref:S28 family serine protease n=1 Tax=Lutibacter sp. TH_r2 TaxID=3082083 RepID=UPI0029542C11|nr:S28 family serine protease [Lutibacter sp. TH_r2]MDV7187686.1 S28 family serine protease [Lutibacter sp. TH_r2]